MLNCRLREQRTVEPEITEVVGNSTYEKRVGTFPQKRNKAENQSSQIIVVKMRNNEEVLIWRPALRYIPKSHFFHTFFPPLINNAGKILI